MILSANQISNNSEYLSRCGVKGQNLAILVHKNLNVPDFFIIPSEICEFFLKTSNLPNDLRTKINKSNIVSDLFSNDLLKNNLSAILNTVSVRSSGAISMPGIMHTSLNVGLIKQDFEIFQIYDLSQNFCEMHNSDQNFLTTSNKYKFLINYLKNLVFIVNITEIVCSIEENNLIKTFIQASTQINFDQDRFLNQINNPFDFYNNLQQTLKLKTLLENKIENAILNKIIKYDVLKGRIDQILFFVEKVFASSQSLNVNLYKKNNKLQSNVYTAVIVQKMVYGDINGLSGVCFSRNPITGDNRLYAEVVLNSQGNDLVSGVKTPIKLEDTSNCNLDYVTELNSISKIIEKYYAN